MSQHRDLGPRYLAEGTASSAASQLRNYGIGLILGLAALGYRAGRHTLFGPMTILFFGMSLVTIPEAARVLRRSPRHLPLFCLLISGGLTMAALAWGVILLVAVPRGLGSRLLGPIWRSTYPLVLPQMLFVIGGHRLRRRHWLHALGAARRSLRQSVLAAVLFVIGSLVGAVTGGAAGTLWGAAASQWISAVYGWWQLREAQRGCRPPTCRSPVPVDSPELRRRPRSPVPAADRRPGDRTKTRSPARHHQARRAVAARVLLATGGLALLAVIAVTGWTLATDLTGTHRLPTRTPGPPRRRPGPTPPDVRRPVTHPWRTRVRT